MTPAASAGGHAGATRLGGGPLAPGFARIFRRIVRALPVPAALLGVAVIAAPASLPTRIADFFEQHCYHCHDADILPPVVKSRKRRVVAVTRSCLTNPDGRDILHCHQRTDPVRMLRLERKPNRPLTAQFPSRFQHLLVTRTKNPDIGFNREMRKTAAS